MARGEPTKTRARSASTAANDGSARRLGAGARGNGRGAAATRRDCQPREPRCGDRPRDGPPARRDANPASRASASQHNRHQPAAGRGDPPCRHIDRAGPVHRKVRRRDLRGAARSVPVDRRAPSAPSAQASSLQASSSSADAQPSSTLCSQPPSAQTETQSTSARAQTKTTTNTTPCAIPIYASTSAVPYSHPTTKALAKASSWPAHRPCPQTYTRIASPWESRWRRIPHSGEWCNAVRPHYGSSAFQAGAKSGARSEGNATHARDRPTCTTRSGTGHSSRARLGSK